AVKTPPKEKDGEPAWHIRYHDAGGRWLKLRATAQQVRQSIQEGRLPADVEGSQEPEGEYRLLASYPEFCDQITAVNPVDTKREKPAPSRSRPRLATLPVEEPTSKPPSSWRRWLLVAMLAGAGLGGCLFFWLR